MLNILYGVLKNTIICWSLKDTFHPNTCRRRDCWSIGLWGVNAQMRNSIEFASWAWNILVLRGAILWGGNAGRPRIPTPQKVLRYHFPKVAARMSAIPAFPFHRSPIPAFTTHSSIDQQSRHLVVVAVVMVGRSGGGWGGVDARARALALALAPPPSHPHTARACELSRERTGERLAGAEWHPQPPPCTRACGVV
jgi:hypothetical protein